jgi:hypothetical protein
LKEIPFAQNAGVVTCTLPSIKYWTMLVADKAPCVSNCAPVANNSMMYVAGSFTGSNWSPGTNQMQLIADNLWQIKGVQINSGNFELKFENTPTWAGTDWGLSSGTSGIASVSTGKPSSNISFSIIKSGKYTFSFNDKTLAYSIVHDGTITSVHENSSDKFGFKFYPNPVRGNLMIVNPEHVAIKNIKLTTISGQEKFNKQIETNDTEYNINLEEIPAGIYFISVEYSTGIEKAKIVKQD